MKRRARVAEVYELISENVTKPDFDVSKPKYVDIYANIKAKSRKLAKKIGAEIEKSDWDSDWIYVSPPDSLQPDPYEDENGVSGWEEVLDRLKDYEKIIGQTA